MKSPELLELISDLTRNASEDNICVILGAGADISSGGILFSDLKKKCLFEMGYTVYDDSSDVEIDSLFNNFFSNLHGQERSNILVKLMRETASWKPSEGYQLLLLLAKEHIINSVVTTNFDNLLERTEKEMNIKAFQILDAKTVLPQDYIIDTMTNMSLYIKIHGDIDNNSVSHITSDEINNKIYNSYFSELIRKLLSISTVIIIGYSGYDKRIVDIFNEAKKNIKKIYWCNPSLPYVGSPLAVLLKHDYKYIKINFDELMREIATHIFLDKRFLNSDSVFIWTLIKSKILKLQQIFEKNLGLTPLEKQYEKIIPRIRYERILRKFILNGKKNLCILTGNSGIGKSTFILQQFKNSIFKDYSIIPVYITSENYYNIMDYLAEELGYITHDSTAFILQFFKWCNDVDNNIVLVFDNFQGLDTTTDLEKTFSSIIDMSYYARNFENIKIIISLRTDIWNNVLPFIDKSVLSKILYQQDNSMNQLSSVRIEEFTDEELKKVFYNLEKSKVISNATYIDASVKELIRNPFFYGILVKDPIKKEGIISCKELYNSLNLYSLNSIKKGLSQQQIQFSLEEIAGQMFLNNSDNCCLSLINVSEKTITNFVERGVLKLEKSFVSFRYNMQKEYYISQYICSELLRNENIKHTIIELYHNHLIIEQNYNGFVLSLSLFEEKIDSTLDKIVYWIVSHKENFMIQMAHDIISEMALNREDELISILYLSGNRYKILFPCFLRASNFMSDVVAYKILNFIYQSSKEDVDLRQEIKSLLAYRFGMELRKTENIKSYIENNKKYLLFDQPSEYFILLLRIISNIGLENINNLDKYNIIVKNIYNEIIHIDNSYFNDNVIFSLTDSLVDNAYYILFNAGSDLVEKYYSYSDNFIFNELINKLEKGETLNYQDITNIFECISNINNSIGFIKGNLLLLYYSLLDYEKALKLVYTILESLDESTPVEIIDFYLSCIFMQTYLCKPTERDILVDIMNNIWIKCGKVYFKKPNRIATKIKFYTEFDREFEDGFNPLTYYVYTAPIINKDNLFLSNSDENFFNRLKTQMEETGDFVSVSRILHAMGQMIGIWPQEGLNSLEAFCGYQYPVIRNMLIRILKESYLRYPVETNTFLEHTGSSFREDEIKMIKAVSSLSYTKRMMEQIHWARIFYFILKSYGKEALESIIKNIIQENILSNSIRDIIFELLSVNLSEITD